MSYFFEKSSTQNDPHKYIKNTLETFHGIISINVANGIISMNEVPAWERLLHRHQIFFDYDPERIVNEDELEKFKRDVLDLMMELKERNVSFHHEL